MTGENRAANAQFEFEKCRAALLAAKALASLGLWDDAVSRAYYATFHAVTAALYSAGVQARTHAGLHDLFFEHFVKTALVGRDIAKDFAALQRFREQADYSTIIRFDATSGAPEVERAERLIAEITALLQTRGVLSESA